MTQKERVAALEAQQSVHVREHEYLNRMWAGQLKAINGRLMRIEAALNGWRASAGTANGQRRFTTRDIGVAGGGMAFATAVWWVVDLLRAAAGT